MTAPINLDAHAADAKASVVVLADDALTRGVVTPARHAAILANPGAYVVPQVGFADDASKGPRLLLAVKVSPTLLAEFGLPENPT